MYFEKNQTSGCDLIYQINYFEILSFAIQLKVKFPGVGNAKTQNENRVKCAQKVLHNEYGNHRTDNE